VCDLLVALPACTDSGRTLFAKNSDRPPTEEQLLEWHPPRTQARTRTTYLDIEGPPGGETLGVVGSRPSWMWGFEHGVNEAGVAAGNATIYTTLDPRGQPDALTGMDLVRLALERSPAAADAVAVMTDAIERWGQGGSGHEGTDRPYWSSFLIADPTDAWVVETSGRTVAAQQVVDTWAVSNRTTIASFDAAHRHPRQPVATLVDPRLDADRALLAAPPVSAEHLCRHLAAHVGGQDGWTVCMHVDGVEETRAAMVAELGAAGVTLWTTTGSPCRTPFRRSDLAAHLGRRR
jgi:secernin